MIEGNHQPLLEAELSPVEVESYLRRNPDFFENHPALVEELRLPHDCNGAVSLVTRQIEMLRSKAEKLNNQLEDLVQIARENDAVYQRVHQLALTLIDAKSIEDVLAGLDWGLHQYFQADFVAVRIIEPLFESPVNGLIVSSEHPQFSILTTLIDANKPVCGKVDKPLEDLVFGGNQSGLESCALIPLKLAKFRGIFAIGSRDPRRFSAEMGLSFLVQMGEILGARMAALLEGPLR